MGKSKNILEHVMIFHVGYLIVIKTLKVQTRTM